MLNFSECSSCAACANVCARNAISMQLDAEGFYRPVIDSEKCVRCGKCEKICPSVHLVENPNASKAIPLTLAAYAKNERIRLESSSGGVFSVLAERILDDGGVIVGVAQLSKTHFGHVFVEEKAGLKKLRGSKYVQADVGLVYRNVKSLIKNGRKVLFSGTPCQVAGLYAALENLASSTNLFTVDVVCHGAPSVRVFEKYVDSVEKNNSAEVLFTSFRDKRIGWNMNSMTMSLISVSGENFQISESEEKNKYLRLFIKNFCLNESCSTCRYSRLPRIADITLGDYWGVEKCHPEMYDDKGTSVILINTDRGRALFETVKENVNYCESDIRLATSCQQNITGSSTEHPQRKDFLKDLEKMNFDMLYSKYCPSPSVFRKAYRFCRNTMRNIIKKHLFM